LLNLKGEGRIIKREDTRTPRLRRGVAEVDTLYSNGGPRWPFKHAFWRYFCCCMFKNWSSVGGLGWTAAAVGASGGGPVSPPPGPHGRSAPHGSAAPVLPVLAELRAKGE
jgi:hypothetical protein